MTGRSLTFKVLWDDEAKVFYTECDEICGIVAEAETVEKLQEDLMKIIPEMLKLNSSVEVKNPEPISLKSQRILQFQVA